MPGLTTQAQVQAAAVDRNCSEAEVWEGMARMAHARQRAGVKLAGLDHEAMRRFPEFRPVKPTRLDTGAIV